VVALGGDDLVVVLAEPHAHVGPGVEVGGRVDAAAGALVAAHRPVLLEGLGTVDGRRVGAGGLVDVVDGAVRGHLALLLRARRGVVRSKVLDDVVLDERAARPAVDGQVAVAVGLVATRVVDGAGRDVRGRIGGEDRRGEERGVSYRALPGFQPLPPTVLPWPLHRTLYWPPAPLV
jgi:hypothetical protein